MAEVIGKSLNECKSKLSYGEVKSIAFQVSKALSYLHENDIAHRNLSDDNIFLDGNGRVKLFNYGMYYMTGGGEEVLFPLGCVKHRG